MQRLSLTMLLFILFINISSCGYFIGEKINVKIPDIKKNWEKNIVAKIPEGEYVFKMKALLSGKTKENFTLNGKEIKSGLIDIILYEDDYYGSDYLIEYQSLANNEGYLEIDLFFYYN